MSTGVVSDHASHYFFETGLRYYIAARFAARANFAFTTGNLFHHALEMLLKGEFSKKMPLADLKDKYRHRLPALWSAFKAAFPCEDLSAFDAMIENIHRFETIRYPDDYLIKGAIIITGWTARPPETSPRRKEPEYFLDVREVDDLVARLFNLCSKNPKAYLWIHDPAAREALTWQNAHSHAWLESASE